MKLGLPCAVGLLALPAGLGLLALPAAVAVPQTPSALDPPYLLELSIRPKRFVPATSGGPVSPSRGTTVTYRLSGSGPVRFWAARPIDGYWTGKRCVREHGARRGRKICTYFDQVGRSWIVDGEDGRNTFRFTGRPGGKALGPRWYHLFGLPVGSRVNKKRHHFRILPRRPWSPAAVSSSSQPLTPRSRAVDPAAAEARSPPGSPSSP